MKSWANFLKNEIMNKEDIYAGQEGEENQREKPAGCLWPLLWLILCLPIVPIVVYTTVRIVDVILYQNTGLVSGTFSGAAYSGGQHGLDCFFMHVAKGRAKMPPLFGLACWPVH